MIISVIIPTYRPQAYLTDCLRSLAQQTLPSSLFEILVILNGERDPYFEQITNLLPSNGRLFYESVGNVGRARNRGLQEAKGDYIAFIDDDDYVSPNYLEGLLKVSSPSRIGISNCISFNELNQPTDDPYVSPIPDYLHDAFMHQKTRSLFSTQCLKLIHRDIIGSTRYSTAFSNGEDSLFMFSISDRIQTIQYTSASTIYYRRVRTESARQRERWGTRLRTRLHLVIAYSKVYWRSPRRYSFSAYLYMVLAAIYSIFIV